ncbi:hypothetical protein RIF29_19272 [Crotalaria pallida]|uniref:Uncharacterized protein n=1 Tax=Crotalaria pallida TaxID=3830 RepID=A0AAN9F333_CROPI
MEGLGKGEQWRAEGGLAMAEDAGKRRAKRDRGCCRGWVAMGKMRGWRWRRCYRNSNRGRREVESWRLVEDEGGWLGVPRVLREAPRPRRPHLLRRYVTMDSWFDF